MSHQEDRSQGILLGSQDFERNGDYRRVGTQPCGKPNGRTISPGRKILRIDFQRDRVGGERRTGVRGDARSHLAGQPRRIDANRVWQVRPGCGNLHDERPRTCRSGAIFAGKLLRKNSEDGSPRDDELEGSHRRRTVVRCPNGKLKSTGFLRCSGKIAGPDLDTTRQAPLVQNHGHVAIGAACIDAGLDESPIPRVHNGPRKIGGPDFNRYSAEH